MLCTIGRSIPAPRLADQGFPEKRWPNDRVFIRDFLAHVKLVTTAVTEIKVLLTVAETLSEAAQAD
jgi:hypothetical protein